MIAALIAPMEMPATQLGRVPGLHKRLVGASLIGAERPAALKDKHGLFRGIGHMRNLDLVRL